MFLLFIRQIQSASRRAASEDRAAEKRVDENEGRTDVQDPGDTSELFDRKARVQTRVGETHHRDAHAGQSRGE